MQIGFIGLGKMGSRMVEKLLSDGYEVVVWNRTTETTENFRMLMMEHNLEKNLTTVDSIPRMVEKLHKQRIMWSMLPAGDATESALMQVSEFVEKDDIVIDGGNAFYQDTQRRFEFFAKRGVRFLGIGVSGGIIAEEQGYPFMVGGDSSAYSVVSPILDSLSEPHGGHVFVGSGGAGHFVKMVHNGIEYGMMQAIGEGFGVLEKAPYDFDLLNVAHIWQKGTIISGFLIDRAADALAKDKKLSDIVGVINATGEAEWTINQAKEEGVPVPVIQDSFDFRIKSQQDSTIQETFAAKMVAALRREFGGHSVKQK